MSHKDKVKRRKERLLKQLDELPKVKELPVASTKHHRKPRSLGGTDGKVNGYPNVVRVRHNQHHAWHVLVSNLDAPNICRLINDTWLDPDYEFVCIPRQHKRRKK